MATIEQYRNKAHELFRNNISDALSTGTNYWQIGCVFDTATDYLQQDAGFADPKVEITDVQAFMEKIYTNYQSLVLNNDDPGNPNYCWYDDFGWWGIACSKALWPSYANIFGDLARKYQQVALCTWDTMKNGKYDHVHFGAPNVWETCKSNDVYGVFSNCAPRFQGGVWQYDIFADYRPLDHTPPGCNPSTPIDLDGTPSYNALSLGPYQNTVTNGLYFVLANRMNAAGYENKGTVDAILGFFDNWFHDSSLQEHHRLDQTVQGGRLILERVSTYQGKSDNAGHTSYPEVHWWDSKTAWGGDQGLMLGALAEYKRDHGSPAWIDGMLSDIMGGVAGSMKNSDATSSYVMPWYPVDPLYVVEGKPLHVRNKLQAADSGDYSSGIGVYMRYLNQAYGFDTVVKTALDTEGHPMRHLVLDSAAAVINNKLPNWGNDLFDDFNRLAVMVMAISLVKDN